MVSADRIEVMTNGTHKCSGQRMIARLGVVGSEPIVVAGHAPWPSVANSEGREDKRHRNKLSRWEGAWRSTSESLSGAPLHARLYPPEREWKPFSHTQKGTSHHDSW
uniref:Uncharacterized protein n=1 Tax=Vespula pensylvanica TaxID=30213 RepID=A0A834PG12_VESPE|nr:hypothetical protein H0235_001410 [Vespula pensylvanica]